MSMRSSSCFAMEIAIRSSCLRGKRGKARCLGSGTQTTRTICGRSARTGRYSLEGRKILASGAGHIERPLVTATDEDGRRLMILPKLQASDRADLSGWKAQGMRASATGAVDFPGVGVEPIEIVGRDGD